MRADRVKGEKDQDQGVRNMRELKLAISKSEHRHADEDEKIFQQPIAAIERPNRQRNPKDAVTANCNWQEIIVDLAHRTHRWGKFPTCLWQRSQLGKLRHIRFSVHDVP